MTDAPTDPTTEPKEPNAPTDTPDAGTGAVDPTGAGAGAPADPVVPTGGAVSTVDNPTAGEPDPDPAQDDLASTGVIGSAWPAPPQVIESDTWVAIRSGGITEIRLRGWIGPEALQVADLAEFKAFVSAL